MARRHSQCAFSSHCLLKARLYMCLVACTMAAVHESKTQAVIHMFCRRTCCCSVVRVAQTCGRNSWQRTGGTLRRTFRIQRMPPPRWDYILQSMCHPAWIDGGRVSLMPHVVTLQNAVRCICSNRCSQTRPQTEYLKADVVLQCTNKQRAQPAPSSASPGWTSH